MQKQRPFPSLLRALLAGSVMTLVLSSIGCSLRKASPEVESQVSHFRNPHGPWRAEDEETPKPWLDGSLDGSPVPDPPGDVSRVDLRKIHMGSHLEAESQLGSMALPLRTGTGTRSAENRWGPSSAAREPVPEPQGQDGSRTPVPEVRKAGKTQDGKTQDGKTRDRRVGRADVDLKPIRVEIVALGPDSDHALLSPVSCPKGTDLALHVVLLARESGHNIAIGSREARRGSRLGSGLPGRAWRPEEVAGLTWFKVEPGTYSGSNTDPSWHWDRISFVESPVVVGRSTIRADAVPTNYKGNQEGYGLMRYKVTFVSRGGRAETPGAQAMSPREHHPEVFEVAFGGRTGTPIIDAALELFNAPYIWGSASRLHDDDHHQAEWRYGADCADFVSYAARRAGYQIGYGWTGSYQPQNGWTRAIARHPRIQGGVYVNSKGGPISFGTHGVRSGDLILYKGHIGILAEDRGLPGVFDPADRLAHILWDAPRLQSVAGVLDGGFDVLRLRAERLERPNPNPGVLVFCGSTAADGPERSSDGAD